MSDWHLRQAARAVRSGGVIAYPTEAVYGLGCDPLNRQAVLRVLTIKRRPIHKGLILIAASEKQLAPFLAPIEPAIAERLKKTWPGPVTWLLEAQPDVPSWLRGAHTTIAVRVTAHPVACELCQAAGTALVSTSANISNRPPARQALMVRRLFGRSIDYLVPGRVGDLKRPTTIWDGRTGKIIRP
jgi:Sua5/YciO/YrdC/YwlC family protein